MMLINSLVDIENWLSQDYPNSQVSVSIEENDYCVAILAFHDINQCNQIKTQLHIRKILNRLQDDKVSDFSQWSNNQKSVIETMIKDGISQPMIE